MKRFIAIAMCLCTAQAAQSDAVFVGSFVWNDPRDDFGGISAIHLSDTGRDFIAVSDSGYTTFGQLIRTEGRITGVAAGPLQPLQNLIGKPVSGKAADAEAIAVSPTGTFFVAFEGNTRIRRYEDLNGPASNIPSPREFRGLQANGSLEAIAIDKDGNIYTIPERSGRQGWPFPVYRFRNGQWDVVFEIARRGAFVIVGADIGPDGLLYVLERDFSGFGFRTRLRRMALDGSGEDVLLQTTVRVHDNLEGISVWHDGTHLRITLVSDNNFRRFQQTEIVEYRITD